jgi:hypothetical protein
MGPRGGCSSSESMGEPSFLVVSLGPDFPNGLWGVQFSGTAAGGTKPAGLRLLLPLDQWEPWVLLTQGRRFP